MMQRQSPTLPRMSLLLVSYPQLQSGEQFPIFSIMDPSSQEEEKEQFNWTKAPTSVNDLDHRRNRFEISKLTDHGAISSGSDISEAHTTAPDFITAP